LDTDIRHNKENGAKEIQNSLKSTVLDKIKHQIEYICEKTLHTILFLKINYS